MMFPAPPSGSDAIRAIAQPDSGWSSRTSEAGATADEPAGLDAIIELIRVADRFDFASLSWTAVRRRVDRRMGQHGVASLSEYLDLLSRNRAELTSLRTELLGNGTVFFAGHTGWEFIAHSVVPAIVRHADPARPVRVWIPQCGAGADAYAIAMLLIEETRATGSAISIQVFASDVDEPVLGLARAGQYPWTVAARVGPARLRQFFVGDRDGCQVTRELRSSVVFAQHDLFVDPPFSHLDLVCCRNVLNHLSLDARNAALRTLYYALDDGGYLALGRDDDINAYAAVLEPVSRRCAVYRKVQGSRANVSAHPGLGAFAVSVPAAFARLPPPVEANVRNGEFPEALPIGASADLLRKVADRPTVRRIGSAGGAGAHSHTEGEVAWILRLVEMGKLAAGFAHEV